MNKTLFTFINILLFSAITVAQEPMSLDEAIIERPDDPAYKDSYFVNANSTTKPEVVDAALNPIIETSEIYSGIYGRASITFYAFNNNGNKGIHPSVIP